MTRSLPARRLILMTAAAMLALPPAPAGAATFTVTKTADTADGACNADCSLREAITLANTTPGTNVINLPAGTYLITLDAGDEDANLAGDLDVKGGPLVIAGAGAATTIIDANGALTSERAIDVLGGVLRLRDVTVQGGNQLGGPNGGGIRVDDFLVGGLVLRNATVRNNKASGGANRAGIYAEGLLDLRDSTISSNTTDAGGDGGGVYTGFQHAILSGLIVSGNVAGDGSGGGVYVNQTAEITGTVLSGNSARFGGGLYNNASTVGIGVTVRGNSASAATNSGGGIYNNGTAWFRGLTVSGNSTEGNGGGIYNDGSATYLNATVSGNSAKGFSGGIHGSSYDLHLTHVTVTGNRADSDNAGGEEGGGILNDGGEILLSNSIVAGNATGTGPGPDCHAPSATSEQLTSNGTNLVQNAAQCDGLTGTDKTAVAPLLGPLADNGGPVQTHALLAGSPALDAGDPNAGLETDARGMPRPQGAGFDLGAYELGTCVGVPANLFGTAGKDTIEGTAAADVIMGFGGDDEIHGGGGDDLICGGDGDDELTGDDGNDKVSGEAGNDVVGGGAGNDALTGDAGNDKVSGGGGKDDLSGGAGKDKVSGGGASDKLSGGGGKDRLSGGGGKDKLNGGGGRDTCVGGQGTDSASNCETTKSI